MILDELRAELERLRTRSQRIPYVDPIDLRYRRFEPYPRPVAQAVMFCLMDVSGSMDEQRKELSKRFFILLYLFLTRHYEKIEIVFIRHHTQAQEVDEDLGFLEERLALAGVGRTRSQALEGIEEIVERGAEAAAAGAGTRSGGG